VALEAIRVNWGSWSAGQVGLGESRGELLERAFVIHGCQTYLPEIVGALSSASCFANTLNGWQKHANQNSNDRNDDE
jgi:hypothetical protein